MVTSTTRSSHDLKALFRAPDSTQLWVESDQALWTLWRPDSIQLDWAEWASVVTQFSSGHMMSTIIPISFT